MKIAKLHLVTFIILALFSLPAFCQVVVQQKGDKITFYNNYKDFRPIDTLHATPAQMVQIHEILRTRQLTKDHFYCNRNLGIKFDNKAVKSEVYEGADWGGALFDNTSIIIDGDCAVEFAAPDITEKNAVDYRYRVVQNDSKELVTWSKPSVFKYTTDKRYKYAYLGKFDYNPGQVLKVEIYNLKNIKQQDAMLVDWRKVEAANVSGTVGYIIKKRRLPDNGLYGGPLNEIKHAAKSRQITINGQKVTAWERIASLNYIETTDARDIKIRLGDSLQHISFRISNGNRLYNYRVIFKREVDGYKDSIDFGETNSTFYLYKEFWKNPGKYSISFTPKLHKHGGEPIRILHNLATSISFTVLPALDTVHSIPIKTFLLLILIMLTTAGFMFVQYRAGQKRRLKKEAQNRQIATLQLQSVRSQLNPHFMFNALAGIQNLMNKNEVELANKYLARFARITRNVLDDGNKELTTIEQEADLLNDYLQMEQMRFGFEFRIDIDDIDQQIEIPAMLLQPFVENAVKHGVSTLKDRGVITIGIAKKENDLILNVQDNGKGFSNDKTTGIGIKLCEERIKLLNSIYKNTTILLHKNTHSNGTLITIELKNWL
ncbi:MAG: hypothetical protein JWR09_4637 [Mucilaginibacter sp.]|nr:hypothetical protein [Mucilaginibacter sp.]